MKKSVLLTLLASMFCLAACGGGEGGGGGGGGGSSKIKLKARFHVEKSSKEGTAYKQLIDAFNEENRGEITVTASFVARTAGEDAFERQLYTDKIDGTLPDLFSFDSPNCGTYAKAEYLLNISDYFTETELNKFVNTNKYNGQLYGLPIQESSAGFYYNKQIFSAAGINVDGITAENPWTVTRFKEVCQQLKDYGTTPVDMRMDATKDETAMYLLYPFIYAHNGDFVDETGYIANGHLNSANSIRGFQFLKDLLTANYTSYNVGSTDFVTGKAGMYLSSGWTIPELDHDYPKQFPNRDTWGLLPYPKADKAVSCNGSWSFGLGNNKKNNKDSVIKLLKFLTNPTSSKAITDKTGMIPANKDVVTGYANGSPEDTLYKQLQSTSKERPVTVGYKQLSSTFSLIISGLGAAENVATFVNNKTSVLQNDLDHIKR